MARRPRHDRVATGRPQPRASLRRAVGALVVSALVTAACSSGGGGSASNSLGTDPTLVAKAQATTLQTADFAAGFEAQPDEPGQGLSIDLVWKELLQCLGVKRPAPTGLGTSPTFLRGLATQGRSTVEYTSEKAAATLATALAGPKAPACLNKVFAADLDRSKPEGATPGPVTVTPRDIAPAGQKTMAWRINASVNLAELVVPLFQDFIVIFNGGTVVRMYFLNPGSEFPQDLERSLLDKVVARA